METLIVIMGSGVLLLIVLMLMVAVWSWTQYKVYDAIRENDLEHTYK